MSSSPLEEGDRSPSGAPPEEEGRALRAAAIGAHALAMVGGGTERRRRGWRRHGDGRAARGVEVAGRQRRGGSARREASVVCVCYVGAWVA